MKITRAKISGSRQRLAIGGWIMLALLLAGFNTSKLMLLLSPPISERSTEVKLASHKWEQLRDKMSSLSETIANNMDLDMALLGISSDSDNDRRKAAVMPATEEKKAEHEKIQLPILTGILSNTDIYGRATILAVIDGQRLKENDKIREFRIRKIKANGVVVTRGNQSWFISAPDVPYSRIPASGGGAKVVMNEQN
ncbi:MAG: hypothetical protein KJO34_13875 [Deltaproteobacteria bacterium]|nr:hypothetical protein [Deltaproteobacteria bacterium]